MLYNLVIEFTFYRTFDFVNNISKISLLFFFCYVCNFWACVYCQCLYFYFVWSTYSFQLEANPATTWYKIWWDLFWKSTGFRAWKSVGCRQIKLPRQVADMFFACILQQLPFILYCLISLSNVIGPQSVAWKSSHELSELSCFNRIHCAYAIVATLRMRKHKP